ncbi:MAG: hypothetical protein HND56_04640 [Pseudomonadota bacterium]|jgi:type IV pilus biogenesis protein CpaD/CtpE|nr:hypothetical protein [Pseudomonadota bacterium]QKK05020.1 MAG: hypothetical protein HND56_04640 [Pseudomonadota bacterium]
MTGKRKLRLLPVLSGMMLSALALSGCQFYEPVVETQIYPVKMRMQQHARNTVISTEMPADENIVRAVAADYAKRGEGGITLQMRYQEGDKKLAHQARHAGEDYLYLFEKYGIENTRVEMVPLPNHGKKTADLVVNYNAWKLSAPDGCGPERIPGYYGAEGGDKIRDYKIGCETETYLSRMISDPRDLKGRSGLPRGDAAREGDMQQNYRTGVPNEPLEGLSSSDIGD